MTNGVLNSLNYDDEDEDVWHYLSYKTQKIIFKKKIGNKKFLGVLWLPMYGQKKTKLSKTK